MVTPISDHLQSRWYEVFMSQNSSIDESVAIHRLLFGSPLLLSHEMVETCQFTQAEPVDCYGFIGRQA